MFRAIIRPSSGAQDCGSPYSTWYSILQRFSKNTQMSGFMKIRHVVAELFFPDGQPDRHDEANSRFSQI
jgi:hypothetical protein